VQAASSGSKTKAPGSAGGYLLLFGLAPEMISNVFDAGQGIGIIEAVLLWSPIQMVLPWLSAIILDARFEYSFVLNALTGFLPVLGLVTWLFGQLVGRFE
jgi:hypothetical protein